MSNFKNEYVHRVLHEFDFQFRVCNLWTRSDILSCTVRLTAAAGLQQLHIQSIYQSLTKKSTQGSKCWLSAAKEGIQSDVSQVKEPKDLLKRSPEKWHTCMMQNNWWHRPLTPQELTGTHIGPPPHWEQRWFSSGGQLLGDCGRYTLLSILYKRLAASLQADNTWDERA